MMKRLKGTGEGRLRAGLIALGAALVLASAGPAQAQRNFDDVEIKTTRLADGFYMLEGAGGNIGLSVGEDGAFLIDDQFAPLTPKIKAAVEAVTDQPVTFVLNTHYHGDHTGGNEDWGDMGAVIVAQENVRARLAETAAQEDAPFGADALPVVTFHDEVTFHWNGDIISVYHLPNAHTDGDALIYFHRADIIHIGDVFRTTSYPRVDGGAGGSLQGILDGLGRVIALAGPDTKIVPGHGVVSSRNDVSAVLTMMGVIRDRIAEAKAAGKTLEEVKAMKPTAEYDERWSAGSVTGDAIIEVIYNELP